MSDQYYFPTFLGGSGDFMLCFKEFPYANHATNLKDYYLCVMGYHLSNLIIIYAGTHCNDFIEMGLHSLATIFLLFGSYLFNIWECGAIISFLHDMSDIFGYLTKMLSQTTYKKLTFFTFMCHLFAWGWFRNIVFPFIIYQIIQLNPF